MTRNTFFTLAMMFMLTTANNTYAQRMDNHGGRREGGREMTMGRSGGSSMRGGNNGGGMRMESRGGRDMSSNRGSRDMNFNRGGRDMNANRGGSVMATRGNDFRTNNRDNNFRGNDRRDNNHGNMNGNGFRNDRHDGGNVGYRFDRQGGMNSHSNYNHGNNFNHNNHNNHNSFGHDYARHDNFGHAGGRHIDDHHFAGRFDHRGHVIGWENRVRHDNGRWGYYRNNRWYWYNRYFDPVYYYGNPINYFNDYYYMTDGCYIPGYEGRVCYNGGRWGYYRDNDWYWYDRYYEPDYYYANPVGCFHHNYVGHNAGRIAAGVAGTIALGALISALCH